VDEELGWTFEKFELKHKSWEKDIKAKIGAIDGRREIGLAMQEGLFLAIDHAKIYEKRKSLM
jgi:hypothetical protein